MRFLTRLVAGAAVALSSVVPRAVAGPVDDRIAAEMPSLLALYRDLHAHPELSLQEKATAAKLAALVRPLGFAVTEHVGGNGVVAVLRNGPGPVVMIRADMDALPLEEKTGLPFASHVRATTRDGVESAVMHACGHDTHMAAWIGVARTLSALRSTWSGTLVMILQPAEEISVGAKAMLDDGLFTRFPKPQAVLAFHDSASLAAGQIGIAPGYMMANVDRIDIRVRGIGGHGAVPQRSRDPLLLASHIVVALQSLVSREQDPLDPAVVTVGSFIGGTQYNIIPDEARLMLTVRSYSDESRTHLLDGIARIAKGQAISAGVPEDRMPVVTVAQDYTPATFNPPAFAGRMADVFRRTFGEGRVETVPPAMTGEDFGRFWRADPAIDSLLFWVGGIPAAQLSAIKAGRATAPSLHSSTWAPDAEAVIATGARALTAAALELMAKSSQ